MPKPKLFVLSLMLALSAGPSLTARGLTPEEVLVVANSKSRQSVALAELYLSQRGIPKQNLALVETTTAYDIQRADYENQVLQPLRRLLRERDLAGKIHCIVVLYGVPVRIGPAAAKATTQKAAAETDAALDSELALLWWPEYPLEKMLVNPLHWRVPPAKRFAAPPVLMTARIDGPTQDDAMRIILGSASAEKTGLQGTFYIDAGGGPRVGAPGYDNNLVQLNELLRRETKLKAVLDTRPDVFPPNACPNAALYVGWYSLRKYVPAFQWQTGAVGWHIASFEAEDLRNADSTRWCVKMIQGGVTATIGAVAEPTLGAFPLPQEFFPLLLTGKYTVAECYWRTNPMVSWRMTLIADPLYNPFAKNRQLPVEKLLPGLAP